MVGPYLLRNDMGGNPFRKLRPTLTFYPCHARMIVMKSNLRIAKRLFFFLSHGPLTMLGFLMTLSSADVARSENGRISEKIGVPVIPSAGGDRDVDSAFMSPDGKHIYTLRKGKLTKLSIIPFRKVSSFEIEFKDILSGNNLFKVFISQDEKRLIISNNKKSHIILVDIPSGNIIDHILIGDVRHKYDKTGTNTKAEKGKMVDAVLNGREILVFKTDKILVLDAENLSKKKETPIDWRATKRLSSVHKVYDKIVYIGLNGVGLIDSNSYQKMELYTYWGARNNKYCGYGNIGRTYITFDARWVASGKIKKFNICGYPVDNDESISKKRKINLGFGPTSAAGHYVITGYRYVLDDLNSSKKFKIIQYADGEVVLFDMSSSGSFIATPKARKYLKMKNSSGDVVPMNDATFEEYNSSAP